MGKLEVDQELIRELAALLQETGLGEIEIEDAGRRLRVALPPAMPTPAVALAPQPTATPAEAVADLAAHPGAITSPMVGTVYRAPEPGAAAFVEVVDTVRRDQTLLMIEAMKTFNEITAPKDGRVTQILVENASPVEYGEVLLLLE